MNEIQKRKMLWRIPLVVAILFAVFWGIWYLACGEIPVVTQTKGYEDVIIQLPFPVSNLWSIPSVFILTLALVFLFTHKSIQDNKDLIPGLILSLILGLLVNLIFFGLSTGLFLALALGLITALAFGLVFGLVFGLDIGLIFGLGVALALGLGAGLGTSLSVGLIAALALALLTFTLIAGLGVGLIFLFSSNGWKKTKNWLTGK